MKRCSSIVVINALQYHHMPKSAATATFVHVYDGTLNTTSRTAGQVMWFLCAVCSDFANCGFRFRSPMLPVAFQVVCVKTRLGVLELLSYWSL